MAKTPGKRGPGRGTGRGTGGGETAARGKGTRDAGSGRRPGAAPGWLPEAGAGDARDATGAGKGGARSAAGGMKRGGFKDPHARREAERYERPIASREAILQLLSTADGPLTATSLAERLELTAPDRAEALAKRLAAMVRDGQLLQNRRGGYVPAEQLDLIPGTIIANPDGFGFLRPDSGVGDDLFLPPAEMRKVMHADRAMASVTGLDRRGRREGVVVEVLERRLNRLIG